MTRLAPGIHHDVPAAMYHADPCEAPSLSSSMCKLLLSGAPIHARMAHPRLSDAPIEDTEPTRVKEIGTAAHKLILGRGADMVRIDAADYKSGDARKARAAAYADGKCPILHCDAQQAIAMFDAQCLAQDGAAWSRSFSLARPEVVVIARDPSGAMLRIMIDKLYVDEERGMAIIWDVKTGDQPAAPQGLGRRIEALGMEIQAALYIHVLALARPDLAGRITFRWLFIENAPPHLCVACELDATGLEIGRRKVAYAIAIWNECLRSGEWPGYPRGIVLAEYPPYAEARWMERENDFADQGVIAVLDAPLVRARDDLIEILGPC